VESSPRIIISLSKAQNFDNDLVGSKTRNLSLILNRGFRVPQGFCITTEGYSNFIIENNLFHIIDMEVFKKSFEDMRWEEIWDASLRIRSAFLKAKMPLHIEGLVKKEIESFGRNIKFSVRSSSPAEDSFIYSFAGIHESYTNVKGIDEILKAIKLVWASLWSDRAILYREELSLDSINSSIAVLVQKMDKKPVSGLAFSKDPRNGTQNLIIEAVSGFLSKLVDNEVEPQKWFINRDNGEIINHLKPSEKSLMSFLDVKNIGEMILKIENIFGFPVDVEWTGKGDDFTVLQVRPITGLNDQDEDRQWYLTLTPSLNNLKALSKRIENELMPQLEREGIELSKESPDGISRTQLAQKIKERAKIYFKWKDIYWNEFIPFAHGIRNFGTFYNDLVKPDDPYEFMEILKSNELIASKRNRELLGLAKVLNENPDLKNRISAIVSLKGKKLMRNLLQIDDEFRDKFVNLLDTYMDVSYDKKSMNEYPEVILGNIIKLSNQELRGAQITDSKAHEYLDKLYSAAGESRRAEVEENLRMGRLSWKLRDDDNILFGKVENQLLIFLNKGKEILVKEKRIDFDVDLIPENWEAIYNGLMYKNAYLDIDNLKKEEKSNINYKPRQLIGQPSSPGIVTSKARIISSLDDFSKLESGEIIVCDAVQPQMTFLMALASGIVERRGGMLVHSSIIAREMGIPSVNGVSKATEIINNGDLITVNGYLGLVIIGAPEFNLERGFEEIKEW